MSNDQSWVSGTQDFSFAACGGTLMDDLDRQMEKSNRSSLVWGMFGGNNAYFGAIARACIYQPYSQKYPFGWGPNWDEYPSGTGPCKKFLNDADTYIHDPLAMRKEVTKGLNDIFAVSQNEQHRTSHFDLYVSSYVRFFDETTDDCDKWSFAHDRVSSGHPKLVKGLRQAINEKVKQFNSMQEEIIKTFEIPQLKLPNSRIHNVQPNNVFDGHRFCETNRTFEGQFYRNDLWLWNLQYQDEQKGEQAGIVMTDDKGTKFMGSPQEVDMTQRVSTVLGADDVTSPPGDDTHTQQYGFGWTARPFHPKWEGHRALKDFFIQKMRDDKILLVRPAELNPLPPNNQPPLPVPDPSPPPPPPPPKKTQQCYGLGQSKYLTMEGAREIIENKFCPEAVDVGAIERKYYEGTPEETVIRLKGPKHSKPSLDDCKMYLFSILINGCDGNDPQNPQNYKGGGKETIDDVSYEVQPTPSDN